jgi:hypothetical protein
LTLVDDIGRQVIGEVRDLVSLEALDRVDQLLVVHRRDQRLAYRVADLDQDLAVAIGFDAIPDCEAIFKRKRFQDVGDIGWMKPIENRLQLVRMH